MFEQRTAAFAVNLVQDVNILRPLMFMAKRAFGFRVVVLASEKFCARDSCGIWQAELADLSEHLRAELCYYRNPLQAFQLLTGSGVIFAASESNLREHEATHALFSYAPLSFLRVTLQHGLECVGFQHSGAHDVAYGAKVSSSADLLCSWKRAEVLSSMPRSQRCKVHVTGPTAVLQTFNEPFDWEPNAPGLVCENLHSVRMSQHSHSQPEFVEAFRAFCARLAEQDRQVVLRPHPGGQFALKSNLKLPTNASINNAPMYRVDLRRFTYGISGPSSVIFDMLLAGIPTAVWRDEAGTVDTSNYNGLTHVTNSREWFEFSSEACASPAPFIELQRRYIEAQQVPTSPRDVFERFSRVFSAASRVHLQRSPMLGHTRLLFVANARLPTVQVCLEAPLNALIQSGDLFTELLTEERLRQQRDLLGSDAAVEGWLTAELCAYAPTCVIMSRYSGPYAAVIADWCERNGVPLIYHIDDDLLAVPVSLGKSKHAYHNDPKRLEAVRLMLSRADVVYVSTQFLRKRLLEHHPAMTAVAGRINCSGRILHRPRDKPSQVFGYMASADHLANLEMVLPAIIALLERRAELTFELFGSIPVPPELEAFGDRVRTFPPVGEYQAFLKQLGDRRWDIGISPLVPTDFNSCKSNNKWVEYTSLGIATIASAGTVYDDCCSDACGVLATDIGSWTDSFEVLMGDNAARVKIIENAQRKLEAEYSIAEHREQILNIIHQSQAIVSRRAAGTALLESQTV